MYGNNNYNSNSVRVTQSESYLVYLSDVSIDEVSMIAGVPVRLVFLYLSPQEGDQQSVVGQDDLVGAGEVFEQPGERVVQLREYRRKTTSDIFSFCILHFLMK